jgi:hypothetical protein
VNTDPPETFHSLAAENGVSWSNLLEGSPRTDLLRAWGVEGFPAVYVLDREGIIRAKGLRADALEATVDRLVGGDQSDSR